MGSAHTCNNNNAATETGQLAKFILISHIKLHIAIFLTTFYSSTVFKLMGRHRDYEYISFLLAKVIGFKELYIVMYEEEIIPLIYTGDQ